METCCKEIEKVAKGIAQAKTFVLRSDLGIEQSKNSTLNAYLARLLFLITGHFGREGVSYGKVTAIDLSLIHDQNIKRDLIPNLVWAGCHNPFNQCQVILKRHELVEIVLHFAVRRA